MVQVIQLSDLHDIAVYVSTEALTWLLFKYASLPCLVNLIPISPSEEQNQQLSDRFVLHSGKDLIADLVVEKLASTPFNQDQVDVCLLMVGVQLDAVFEQPLLKVKNDLVVQFAHLLVQIVAHNLELSHDSPVIETSSLEVNHVLICELVGQRKWLE